MWLFKLVVNQCGICFDWFINVWRLDTWILNIWLHPWMHLLKSYFTQPLHIYRPFHFDLNCAPQRGYCFLCLNFIQMSASGCHGLLWRIPFALAQTNTQIQSFWGIISTISTFSFLQCSMHRRLCGYSDVNVYFRLLTLTNIWSSGERRGSVCLRLMGVYRFSDREQRWITLTWHRLI